MTDQFPEKFGKYEIIEEVGRGGFADVYRAIDTTLDRTVALKFLEPRLLREPTFVERFQREAKLAANLKHPNIVFIHEFGWEAGTIYIAMEFLEGQTLKEVILEEGALPPRRIVNMVGQIASALDYAHGRGLVHRDIKPSNIMVGTDDHVIVLDFGIAKAATLTALTTTGRIFGTPEYMSPEQAEGVEEPDARSDIYSLGVVVYEMVTGKVPFSGMTPLSIMRGHADKRPPRPSEVNPDVSLAVEAVLLRALAKKREERYQSAGEMTRALEEATEVRVEVTPIPPEPEIPVPPLVEKKPVPLMEPAAVEKEEPGPPTAPPVPKAVPKKALALGRGALLAGGLVLLGIVSIIILAVRKGKPTVTPVPVVQATTPTATITVLATATDTLEPPISTPVPKPTDTPPPELTPKPSDTLTPTDTPHPTPMLTDTATPAPTPVPSLSGQLTDAATGQGIGGARVEAQLAGQQGWDYSTTTTSDGSYAIFGLPTGDYKVRVIALGYAREYYDNVAPSSEAKIVHITAPYETPGIDFDLTEGGSISGYVYQIDRVTPISGAQVQVRPSKHGSDDGFWVTTNSTGYYRVDGLSLGNYKVRAETKGYSRQKYYDGVYGWDDAINVKVNPPDTISNINLSLDLAGSISGFVYKSDGVTPVPGVNLVAEITTGIFEGIVGGPSNEDGHYSIQGLPPGNYTVRIGDWGIPSGYAGEFYDSKYTAGTADKVAVTADSDTSNVNFTLDEGGSIIGHVLDEETGEPISEIQLFAYLPGGDRVTPLPWNRYDGSYEYLLRPGSYLIKAGVGFAQAHGYKYIPEWYDNSYDINNATLVNVTLHNETAGIDIYLAKAGSISGHVYEKDGITPIAGASVYAFPITGDHPGEGANTGPDGSYTVEGLPSGTYRVQVTASGRLSQFYSHAAEEASATEVTVNAPNDTPGIDFALSPVSE